MSGPRVAVLGATGHVGKVLVAGLASCGYTVHAFARSMERLGAFIVTLPEVVPVHAHAIGEFGAEPFDLVVNATGISDPAGFGPKSRDLIAVTEHFDSVVESFLRRHPRARAIAISSGAVYASAFAAPAGASTPLRAPDARVEGGTDVYGAVKAASEARHRAASDLAIVDLRLFGLFSPYLDLDAGFLLSEAMGCLRSGVVLETDAAEMMRDYAHPTDLTSLVRSVLDAAPDNRAYDVYSVAPASKTEMLSMLSERFGLSYTVQPGSRSSASGRKPAYFSTDRSAAALGYKPRFTTLECVADVTASLVESWRGSVR